jgi:hypothetical protein
LFTTIDRWQESWRICKGVLFPKVVAVDFHTQKGDATAERAETPAGAVAGAG